MGVTDSRGKRMQDKQKILFYIEKFLDLKGVEKNFSFQVNVKEKNLADITEEKYKKKYSPKQLKTMQFGENKVQ